MEIAVDSWKKSFCGNKPHQTKRLSIATARAGNVIGGGDWSKDRIVPDIIRGFMKNEKITIRNPHSKRPWQHVLDPLNGYLMLAENLYKYSKSSKPEVSSAFNFGPSINANIKVENLVKKVQNHIPLEFDYTNSIKEVHESKLLYLNSEKARNLLGWEPKINFNKGLEMTINWYKFYLSKNNAIESCLKDINYFNEINHKEE